MRFACKLSMMRSPKYATLSIWVSAVEEPVSRPDLYMWGQINDAATSILSCGLSYSHCVFLKSQLPCSYAEQARDQDRRATIWEFRALAHMTSAISEGRFPSPSSSLRASFIDFPHTLEARNLSLEVTKKLAWNLDFEATFLRVACFACFVQRLRA